MPLPAPQSVIVHLIVKDAARAIGFYTAAFGAREAYRLVDPGGKIGHAEFEIGHSRLMIAEEDPGFGALAAPTIGGSPIKLLLYVDDPDAVVGRALAAGATQLRAVENQFYGDRSGMVLDPFGLSWSVACRLEEVSPTEMQRRYAAALAG